MYQEPNFMTLNECMMRLGMVGETKEEQKYWQDYMVCLDKQRGHAWLLTQIAKQKTELERGMTESALKAARYFADQYMRKVLYEEALDYASK